MIDDDPVHALAPFLKDRLPALGLDYDTYGPYILPLLSSESDNVTTEDNEEEWETVLELLKASSNFEDSDDTVWKLLRADIESAWKTNQEKLQQQNQEKQLKLALETQQQKEQDRLALLAQERKQAFETAAPENDNFEKSVDDEARRRLVEQYGYEEDDDVNDGEDNAKKNPTDPLSAEDVVVSNREVARQVQQAKTQAMREHKQPTKRDEQQKTAEAKKTKEQLKEERRKRAVKGERRR